MKLMRKNEHQPDGFLKPMENIPSRPSFNFLALLLALLAIGVALYWMMKRGYQDGAITIEEIEKSLDPQELESYRAAQKEVDDKFEYCVQYILYALEDGKYQCLSCPPGIPFVTLKEDEIWYIGHTCQEHDDRHSKAFRKKHNVEMRLNYIGPKAECHRIELKLIRGYRYLPESLKPEIKLTLPPFNRTDKY